MMPLSLKRLQFSVAAALLAAAPAAFAQDAARYPDRPLRLIVPFAPGGGLDITARLLGHKLTEQWGQNIVVDSRPGAATIVGTEIAAKAAADGYTILMITTTFAINPGLYPKLPYDPVRDFAPVTQLNTQPNVIVITPSAAAGTVRDLIALAKAKPGELTYASPGSGSAPHLSAELFQRMAGIRMIHVPYKGSPAAVTDVIGGRITMLFTTTISAAPHVKSGKLRAVGVTSTAVSPLVPELPTLAATYPGLVSTNTYMLYAPPGTPAAITAQLRNDVRRIWDDKDTRERLGVLGLDMLWLEGADLSHRIDADLAKWAAVVKAGNIKAE